jgi:hypothetical protein
MEISKEEQILEEDLAAIRIHMHGAELTGVATVIPAGQVIQIHRATPPVGRMRQVEWNGKSYRVFAQDLVDRVDRSETNDEENPGIVRPHREENPGIVEIHPAKHYSSLTD